MTNLDLNESKTQINEQTVSIFGYELIREILIPDLLGKETPQLLYWGGKKLARKFPMPTIEEIISFFHDAGWGDLTLVKSDKDTMEFHLTGEIISTRLQNKKDPTFQLESGFLAQQIQIQRSQLTESFEQQKKRAKTVIFTLKWDKKDTIDE